MEPKMEEIIPVRDAHRFDATALKTYLAEVLEGFEGDPEIQQFGHGQSNPSFLLSNGSNRYVLRKKPPGKLLPSAHAVEREYRILKALGDTDVPVAKVLHLCEDPAVIGTPFYVMTYVQGRIFRDPMVREVDTPEERAAIFDAMNDAIAKIHLVDWQTLGLEDYGKPGNYMARQVSRWWRQYEAAMTDPIESMDRLYEWLSAHIPEDDSTTIVHGDVRLENMILHEKEARVVAVLDWELSTLGHPLADLAYNCMNYRLSGGGSVRTGFEGMDLKSMGIPEEKDYIEAYCRRTGRSGIADWEFFMAFGLYRLAAIVQGVYKRGLDGIASARNAQSYGEHVRVLADAGWKIVKGA